MCQSLLNVSKSKAKESGLSCSRFEVSRFSDEEILRCWKSSLGKFLAGGMLVTGGIHSGRHIAGEPQLFCQAGGQGHSHLAKSANSIQFAKLLHVKQESYSGNDPIQLHRQDSAHSEFAAITKNIGLAPPAQPQSFSRAVTPELFPDNMASRVQPLIRASNSPGPEDLSFDRIYGMNRIDQWHEKFVHTVNSVENYTTQKSLFRTS